MNTLSRPGFVLLALVLTALGAESRQQDSRFAKAARAALAAGKDAAVVRLKDARDAVAADAKEEQERDVRIATALKESTARFPVRLVMDKDVSFDNVRVTAYSAGMLTLTWPQGEVQAPLAGLPDDARALLLGIALGKGTARDHFELGKLLVRNKDLEGAARCFSAAVRRDPSLADAVPDVERLKKASHLFEGNHKLTGNTLSLRWSFTSSTEGNDFEALQGSFAVKAGTGMEIYAPSTALIAVKEIPFRDRVKLSAMPKETDTAAHALGIRFVKPDGGALAIYGVLATASKTFRVVRVEDKKSQDLLPPAGGAFGNRLTMEYNRGRIVFQIGDKSVWSGNEGGFTDVLALVGSVTMTKGETTSGASAIFKEVSLLGEVNPVWMAKKTAGLRDAYTSEFSKEYRAGKGASAGPTLSIDAALTEAPTAVRETYRSALQKVTAMYKSGLQEDFDAALYAMEELTRIDPSFAPAWYHRGVLEEFSGSRKLAVESFDTALILCPDFPEALCGRGRMQATIGAWPAAKESAEKALALKADVAEGQILRARLLKESGETAAAFEATLLGRKLSPLDAGVQSSAARLANYIRGPLWAKTNTHESAHYAVRSNLPVARCKQYAEFLEAMRPHYEEVLGRPLPAGKKAEILVFESQEGYFVYNDYTAGGRMEHTLGAFTPWHAQIALFEGVETQETLRTLAHEGFHQAVLSIAPDVPIWFNEGMAEYVGAARVDKGAVVERGGIQVGRLENLKSALKYGWQPFPFAKLFLDTKADFYGDDAPLRYAQAWGMVRFFMDGDAGRWRPVMKDYIDRILKGETARAAYEATFSKQDAPLMEAGWLKHSGLTSRSSSVLAKDPPPPTAPVMTAMSVDLLALLKKNPIPAGNGWTLKSGILESSRVVVSSLGIGQDPPPEYDWTLSVRRLGGQGPLLLGLQGGGSTFVLRLDDAGTSRIEKVDGPDKANAPSVRPGPALPVGKTAVVICSVRKTGVTVKLDGETLLTWNGDLKNLIYAPDPDMIAACQSLFLFTKETGFQILKMTVATPAGAPGVAAKTPIPGAKTPPGKSIPLDADIRRWVSDEEGRQVMALDTSQNLLLISLPERRVVKKVPAGPGPTCLFPTAGFKSAWVGGGGTIVRIDLEKGEIVESIPTAYAAEAMAVVRKMAYVLTSGSEIRVVDLSEKKDLGGIGDSFSSALGYDGRRERLWGLWSGSLVEYDLPKAGPLIKEQKKNLNDKERGDLTNALNAAAKRHPVTGQDTQLGPKIFLDDRIYRIFAGAVMVKTDSPEKVVGVFRSPAHSLDNDQSVRDFLGAYKGKLPIIAASADGRFAASVTHVFDMATFAVRQELPLPTSMVVFPKDSNDLYYYDWAQHAILVTRLEVK